MDGGQGKLETCARVILCAAVVGAGGYLAAKYALPIAAPFIVAWAVGSAVSPLAERMAAVTRLPRKLCGGAITLLLVALLGVGGFFAGRALLGELLSLAEGLPELLSELNTAISSLTERLSALTDRLPGENGELADLLRSSWEPLLRSVGERLCESIPNLVSRAISSLPGVALTAAVTVVASFCFSAGDAAGQLIRLLPCSVRDRAADFSERLKKALLGWTKAYLLIFVLTVAELTAGLLILRVSYPLVVAVVIAAIDILPLIGAGAVLLPWAAVELVKGNVGLGVGLIALWATVTAVRQIAEPKIVGSSLGMPTVIALVASFVGFRLSGVVGAFTFPLFAALAFSVMRNEPSQKHEK